MVREEGVCVGVGVGSGVTGSGPEAVAKEATVLVVSPVPKE